MPSQSVGVTSQTVSGGSDFPCRTTVTLTFAFFKENVRNIVLTAMEFRADSGEREH